MEIGTARSGQGMQEIPPSHHHPDLQSPQLAAAAVFARGLAEAGGWVVLVEAASGLE